MTCLLLKILDEAVSFFVANPSLNSQNNQQSWIKIYSTQQPQALFIKIQFSYQPDSQNYQFVQNIAEKYKMALTLKQQNDSVIWSLQP
ncbi:hypothetical protein PCC7424_5852 (plasmid) [Gloeothece citriformis PCC 7424]|uniref:Uncharacterized protein n=1 Tax=Gloeothece citriformis (strain PCC 7424) TaxID=65393 RepID=B7KM84_GLOC7|nr:hypothetical protein [Gloeothece citriformis]ACK73906.1 hypothetical protein PCC7424_5852 [Gloeothece citriformis PCC 7424]